MKMFSHPCLFPFIASLSFPPRILFSFHFTSSSRLSFPQLNTINYDPHLRIIRTFCLRLSRSTPLRKTLTVNHYLLIEYFQHTKTFFNPPRVIHNVSLDKVCHHGPPGLLLTALPRSVIGKKPDLNLPIHLVEAVVS